MVEGDLHGVQLPRVEHCLQDVLSDVVRDEVEMQRVLPVEEDTLDERDHLAGRVVARTHDRHVNHLIQTRTQRK